MKVLAIPATNNPGGLNRQLIDHAARLLEDGLVAGAEVGHRRARVDAGPSASLSRRLRLPATTQPEGPFAFRALGFVAGLGLKSPLRASPRSCPRRKIPPAQAIISPIIML